MAGETALARQLKKLAVPQTTVLIQDKIRKSFLFDHRDAAGLDRELIFAYGTNGLEKLRIINPIFSKFESNLFSLSYKDFQRSVQSAAVNKKLDHRISEFLRMLSPYFLIKAAHEALEWLIYRFHIHMYNVDDLIASVIPHYNTSTFVRVVQLLDLDERSRWFWLKPIQKTGVHLDYSALLNRFISDGGFRKFVCDVAVNVLHAYKDNKFVAVPIISFSMLTIYNALHMCKVIEDKMIPFLFPYILKGLSSDLSKYTAASYLIISKIVSKVKLTPEITEQLLIRIFQAMKDDLSEEAFKLLLLVFQTQSIHSLPKKVHSAIIENNESVKILSHLVEKFEAFPLLQAIIKKTIFSWFNIPICTNPKKSKKILKFFKRLLSIVKLDEKSILRCFNATVKKFSKCCHDKKFKSSKKHIKKIAMTVFKNLESKYPDHFDKAYEIFVQSKSKSDRKVLCNLINSSVCSIKYQMLPSMKTSLVLGLNHANTQIRKTSVCYLLELIKKNEFCDSEFIENSLYDRLLDKSPNVVQVILKSPDVLMHNLSKPRVLSAFEYIFRNEINLNSDWYIIQMKCLGIITKYFEKDNLFDVLQITLNFLFPVNKNTIEGFLCLLNSDMENAFIQEVSALKSKIGKIKDVKDEKIFQINCLVIESLKEFVRKMDEESKYTYASFLMSKASSFKSKSFLSFYIFVMQYMIIGELNNSNNTLLYVKNILQVLRYYFSRSNITLGKFEELSEESIIEKYINSLNQNLFPTVLVCSAFHKIVIGIKLNLECNSWLNTGSFPNYEILTILFDFCILHLNSKKERIQEYFKTMLSLLISNQLRNVQTTFWFLCMKWINHTEDIPFEVQLNSLNIAKTFCNEQHCMDWLFDNEMIFFCMVRAIANPNNEISQAALILLSSTLDYANNCVYPLKCLGEEICIKSEEIKIDYRQCFDCVGNWLNPAIDFINTKTTHISKDLQNRVMVLNKMLNLLTQDVPHSMKYSFLLCLQNLDSVCILSAYIPVLNNYLILCEKSCENINHLIELLLKKYTPKTAACLNENSIQTKTLIYCLKFVAKDDNVDKSVQILTLNILNREFFSAIPSAAVQQEIFEVLLTSYMTSPTDVNTKVEKVLRKLCIHAHMFLKHFLDNELAVSKSTTLREAKKLKIREDSDGYSNFETGIWKKITVLLELVQNKSKLYNKEALIPELFNLLNKSLDFDSQASIEYIRQLILSTIFSCCQQLGSTRLDERQFQVELIVQCIRSSTNAKTHHQSLLLLNLAATMFPDYVLSNVMSIFTFMGSSLVRQDDSYSFQVISQTIETIVPSLLEASNQQTETDGVQVVASVIRVFIDSLSDIPGHRQLPLFTKLITTLDPSKYLWIPLGQVCDQYTTVFHDLTTENSKNWKISPILEFVVNLHKQFSPDIQIDTCIKLINFLSSLPDTKEQLESNPDLYKKIKEPFNLINHTDKQLQVYKHNVLSYVKIWLTSQVFPLSELNIKEQYNLEEKYELLLESVLSFLQDRLNAEQSKDARNMNNQIQLLYDLVYAINSLLPYNLFIKVIRRLLKHTEEEIQMKAIELLNTKLEQQQELLHQENHKSLLKLLKPLLKVVNKHLSVSEEEKHVVIQQTALYALHLLCKLIGSQYPTKFYKVLNVSVAILSKYNQPELIVNALLCLAQLCNCLNVDILPRLNSFMPVIISILQDKNILNMNECLVLGIIAALQSIIENIGIFLSSYMEAIITSICIFSVRYFELGKKTISEKFIDLQSKLANEIALRVLLTAIESSYSKLVTENASNIVPLMKILSVKLNCSTYEDILSCSPQLQKFYLSLLDFRNSNPLLPNEITTGVENSIISSLETFVMKLSVTRFRTFFQKIYQWSTTTNEDQELKSRIYTFYKLTSEFSKSLKSLFSHMAKYFFRHAASVLESNNTSKSKIQYFNTNLHLSHDLLVNVLDTLNYCFMYSEEQLLDKENFDLLMQPLVDQIENLDDEITYQDLIEKHLSSCVAYFMMAVSDNALWKALNYQILLKTRHDSPKVRFGSLQVIQEVVNKMGDNYLVLLPESIPFLAEIMEDESSEVEQECQTVIIEMEKILGEPIRKYF